MTHTWIFGNSLKGLGKFKGLLMNFYNGYINCGIRENISKEIWRSQWPKIDKMVTFYYLFHLKIYLFLT